MRWATPLFAPVLGLKAMPIPFGSGTQHATSGWQIGAAATRQPQQDTDVGGGRGARDVKAERVLQGGRTYDLRVEYYENGGLAVAQFGWGLYDVTGLVRTADAVVVCVGYRGYDQRQIEPQFGFGHGLSYTTFEYSDLQVSPTLEPGQTGVVSFVVRNTGTRPGTEIAQLYLSDLVASVPRPPKELKGFAKVTLSPGQATTVTLPIDETALSFFDTTCGRFIAGCIRRNPVVGPRVLPSRSRWSTCLSATPASSCPPQASAASRTVVHLVWTHVPFHAPAVVQHQDEAALCAVAVAMHHVEVIIHVKDARGTAGVFLMNLHQRSDASWGCLPARGSS